MTPPIFYRSIIVSTAQQMDALQIKIPMGTEARVLLIAIAGQESGWANRRQIGGSARGYWQFEKGGGVAEVFQKTPNQLRTICESLDIPFDQATVFEAMAWNDMLSCIMARLLLWQDPAALPASGDKATAWNYYLRNWRPGAPRSESWPARYDEAAAAISG